MATTEYSMKDPVKMSHRELRHELVFCREVLKRISKGEDGFLAQTYIDMARKAVEELK